MLLRIHCHLAATGTSRSAYPGIALRGDDCRHIVYRLVTQFMPNVGREVKKQVYVGLNFHELRHTQATLLIGQGADIKTVQHRLGYASASLTMDISAHAMPSNDKAAAKLKAGVLGRELTEQQEIVTKAVLEPQVQIRAPNT